jgi:conflict system STAND superfamily ATPase
MTAPEPSDTVQSAQRLDVLEQGPTGYGETAPQFPINYTRTRVGDEPYKGTDSYQFEDSPLFFGRAQEERETASLFLKGRLCILHAQSGAGKTSILNARVIPRIEEAGIHAVRLTPQSDPLEAVRVASLLQLLPPPECEADAIQAMIDFAPDLAGKPLEDVLDRFDSIESGDPMRRNLLAAYEVSKIWFDPYRYRSGRTTPFFCKLLAGSMDIRAFWTHFGTLFSFDQIGRDIDEDHWKGATLGEIHALLSSPHARAAHREWLDTLDLPEFGFVPFFRNFWQHWADHQPGYALCLIIDQFEQIFTLYTDDTKQAAGAADPDKPDWRLRPSFFDELRRLLAPSSQGQDVLPISVVLSMRDEFVGQLGSVPPLASRRETTRYRLDFLTVSDARRAIQMPAQAFGYDYDEKIYQEIISALKKEDRYIEAAHIQIVCDKIWRLFGRDLARTSQGEIPKVSFDDFMAKTGGTVQIQQDYFKEILERYDGTDQLEILDMLSDLLTQSSKRNVVEYTTLVGGALRDANKRARLLSELQSCGIVRQEARMGSQFVEIAHEFLIDPLQAEIVNRVTASEQVFRYAQRVAASAFAKTRDGEKPDLAKTSEDLTPNTLNALIENADRCYWSQEALDLLVHAAVRKGTSIANFRTLFHVYDNFRNWQEKSAVLEAVAK